MKKRILTALLALAGMLPAGAKVTLPPLFGDNMVLQQSAEVKIWGASDRRGAVEVTTGWNGKKYKAPVDASGHWEVRIGTPQAGGPYTLTLSDGERTVLNNILIGEVWLCSGQSNMEMPLKGFTASQPTEGAGEAIATAYKHKELRLFTVERIPSGVYTGRWEVCSAQSAADFSAVGFFFGRYIQDVLGVPVGMICSAVGGSRIEEWMDREYLAKYRPDQLFGTAEQGGGLYRAGIKPIAGYGLRGFLWYQGEANWEKNPGNYQNLMTDLVECWRRDWNDDTLPFYFTEVAPFHTATVGLREAQYAAMNSIPHSGMASTIDIGEQYCIHPARKEEIGHRLAFWALAKTYGIDGIRYKNPAYKSHSVDQDKVVVEFDDAELGFSPRNGIMGFEAVYKDGRIVPVPGDAVYIREKDLNVIELRPADLADVETIRYCYHPWVVGRLYNTFGLPVLSFSVNL